MTGASFYSKTTNALRSLLVAKGVSDEEVLAGVCRSVGVKEQVLKDREDRKRAREESVNIPDGAHDEYDMALSE